MPSNLLSLNRVDLTRIACDAIAAQGKKPSIGQVREWTIANCGGKKGSDGDVQRDISSWFDDLLKLKRDKHIEGLPDAVAALARDLWQLS
ncbi:MAG: DNA-binding protein, partial [Janthinobacterium lividum]